MFVDQGIQGFGVAAGVFVEHELVGGPGGIANDLLKIGGQLGECRLVDAQLQYGARLLPAGVVVVLGCLVQTESQVVVGADPVGGVDDVVLQGAEDFAAGQVDGGSAGAGQHLATKAGHANLQAAEVFQAVDFLVEPAGHLHPGVAAGQRQNARSLVGLLPEFQPAALIQPGVHFLGVHAKGYGGKERGGGALALPVIGGAVAQFGGAAGDRVEYFQGGYQLTGGEDLHGEAAVGHGVDRFGEALGGGAQTGEVLGPGGDHLPLEALLGRGWVFGFGGSLVRAAGEGNGAQAEAGGGEELAAFHFFRFSFCWRLLLVLG